MDDGEATTDGRPTPDQDPVIIERRSILSPYGAPKIPELRPKGEVAARIISLRESLGLKQIDLARLVDVSERTIGYWESGDKIPRGENLVKLAIALKVDPRDILQGGEDLSLKSRIQALEEKVAELERKLNG